MIILYTIKNALSFRPSLRSGKLYTCAGIGMGPAFYIPLLCVNATATDIGWRVDIDLAYGENLLGGVLSLSGRFLLRMVDQQDSA